jgi:hypothetical protein
MRANVRARIIGELAELILSRAASAGPTTLTIAELAERFDDGPGSTKLSDLEPLIFGSTPMRTAAAIIRDRFGRTPKVDAREERVLFLLSDGEPTDGDPLPDLTAIRAAGVTIVSCFVTSRDVADPRVLRSAPDRTWPEGARLMFEAASALDDEGEFAAYLLRQGWRTEKGARLFVQANHSDVLEEFVRAASSPVLAADIRELPSGR